MFDSARLKLTLWYLLIIMLISVSFSVVIYKELTSEVKRYADLQRVRIERRLQDQFIIPSPGNQVYGPAPVMVMIDTDLIQDIQRRLFVALVLVNSGIAILAGGLGFFLAGRTLMPIKDMMDEQNRFISDSSHELRTPLTSLKSSIEVTLRDKELKLTEAKAVLKDCLEEVNKLQSLAEGLLQLTQYQIFSQDIKFEKVSLRKSAEKVSHQLAAIAKTKQIVLDNQVSDLKIDANEYSLNDLLTILLENAIKYSPEKSTITLSSHKTDGHVQISVKDQGMGIEAKDIHHIFDRFYRADTARSRTTTGGYGLGLSIAKKIVDSHHGSIKVESQLKVGSTFIIILPIRQPRHSRVISSV